MVSFRFRTALFPMFWTLLLLHCRDTRATSNNNNPQVIQQAIAKCRDKLSQDPTFPKAQHMLGMLLEATADDHCDSDWGEIADLSYQAGDYDERPLEASKRVDALVRAGKTYRQLGQTERAIRAYQRALTLVEDQALAETILHEVTPLFFREGMILSTTIDNSHLALLLTQRFPSSAVALQFQGAVARKAGNLEAAFQSYHQAAPLASQSSKTESYILAAAAARQAGRDLATQLDSLQSAMAAAADSSHLQAEVWNNKGIAYKAAGQTQSAIECFRSALQVQPGDGHALAHLASLDCDASSSSQSATAFDATYVQGLFDAYSSRFEESLVHELDYKGHEWVADQLVRLWNKDNKEDGSSSVARTIVDLGCGTGLVGEALMMANPQLMVTPPKTLLVGVDLSLRMVEMARGKTHNKGSGEKTYQRVHQEDAEAFLKRLDPESVDAILAADVFIYVGELEGLFRACRGALSSKGVLVFSVELTTTKDGMILLPSGRFGHSKGYVQDLAKRTGFDLQFWKEGTLRKQHGTGVVGALVVLQKTGGKESNPS